MRISPRLRVLSIIAVGVGVACIAWQGTGSTEQAGKSVASLPAENATTPADVGAPQNPLWDLPLSSLSASQNRPIFAPNRRPRAIPNASYVLQSPTSTRPPFYLVGAIAAGDESIAILVEEGSRAVVRVRKGESLAGWAIQDVKSREITVSNSRQTAVIELSGAR